MSIAHRTLQVILHLQNEETLDHADVAAGYFMSMGLLMAYAFTAVEAILQAQQVVMTTTMTMMTMKTTTTKTRAAATRTRRRGADDDDGVGNGYADE